ncbi:hypothetical protein BLA29_007030 [Euroglyphus maynei]|uniref:Uncharacterized protein n=1 Tax=Euroglyphus maynei TaxID=6958 RepID=A0A1Y3AUD2_EURMA|nr:hypothetical protein BLA29_007030 [Euroglyphus maynei]
MAVHYRIMYD